ncbi:MAG: D-glycero-beta-D-manno-heptose 1-phosphate adenylyltransferase [Cytophagaceae bacterium]
MTSDKIRTIETALPIIAEWKKCNQKVVFSNGCFDILHVGHVDYLEKARALGDRLVMGLNTDSSIKRIKGPERPVNDENSRSRILAALEFVDAVILFDEDTPFELIKAIKPDILVKGDDYTIDKIIGADIVMENGGEVKTISLVKGYSTSNVIEKIKKSK